MYICNILLLRILLLLLPKLHWKEAVRNDSRQPLLYGQYLDGLVWTAAYQQHYDKADDPEDSLERELHYAKADVE